MLQVFQKLLIRMSLQKMKLIWQRIECVVVHQLTQHGTTDNQSFIECLTRRSLFREFKPTYLDLQNNPQPFLRYLNNLEI